jgi:hypothetical protein
MNQEYSEKNTYLSQVTDKLFHIINFVSSTPRHEISKNTSTSLTNWAVLINFTDVAMEAETDNNSKFLNK